MYGKLYASTFTGSMCGSGPEVFAVWAYIIASTGPDHRVEVNAPLVAGLIGMKVEAVEAVIEKLCAPDPRSRCQDHDGARLIKEGSFSYFVINHARFRGYKNEDDRRQYLRSYMAEYRKDGRDKRTKLVNSGKQNCLPESLPVFTSASASVSVSASDLDRGYGGKGKGSDGHPTRQEWQAHCERVGLPAWKIDDEWLKQESQGWARITNPASHAGRVAGWWRNDGSPMAPPTRRKPNRNAKAPGTSWEDTQINSIHENIKIKIIET